MDREALLKFRHVLASPLWERIEDDILHPELAKLRQLLEIGSPQDERVRGKIEFIKYLLKLPHDAKQIEE